MTTILYNKLGTQTWTAVTAWLGRTFIITATGLHSVKDRLGLRKLLYRY